MAKTTRTGKTATPPQMTPDELGKMLMDRLQTKLKEMGIPAEVVDKARKATDDQRALLNRKGITPGLKINNMDYITIHPAMVRPNVRFGCAIVFTLNGFVCFDNLDTLTRSPMDAYSGLVRRLAELPDGSVHNCGLLAFEI